MAGSLADQSQLALNAYLLATILDVKGCEDDKVIEAALNCLDQVKEFEKELRARRIVASPNRPVFEFLMTGSFQGQTYASIMALRTLAIYASKCPLRGQARPNGDATNDS